jgi:acyl carrier protein
MKKNMVQVIHEALLQNPEVEILLNGAQRVEDINLVGEEGILDSLQLVSLIVEIEQELNDLYGGNISIVNDSAFSQSNSPFKTVRLFASYLDELIAEHRE